MIKGALEVVADEAVAGWLYSSEIELKGRVVLAFQGSQCIGAGKVSTFRKDLMSAGLGDGHYGFEFPITRVKGGQEAIVVKLEEGDLVLAQPALFRSPGPVAPRRKATPEDIAERLASLKWELAHGSLLQPEYDFLRTLAQQGVFERTLHVRKGNGKAQLADPANDLEGLFSLFARRDVKVAARPVERPGMLVELQNTALNSPWPVFALQARQPCPLRIRETSHVSTGPASIADDRYTLQQQTLVIVDARVDIAADMRGEGDAAKVDFASLGVVAYLPVPDRMP
ncbi:MAG: hypothetical protein O9342_10425 [Beijerinckiaceae bacterium]|nr:hypothetical protein [Beijerinckiaceae bacterium]